MNIRYVSVSIKARARNLPVVRTGIDRYSNRELNGKGLASKNILKGIGRADVRSSHYPEEEGPTSPHPHWGLRSGLCWKGTAMAYRREDAADLPSEFAGTVLSRVLWEAVHRGGPSPLQNHLGVDTRASWWPLEAAGCCVLWKWACGEGTRTAATGPWRRRPPTQQEPSEHAHQKQDGRTTSSCLSL